MPTGIYERIKKVNYPKNRKSDYTNKYSIEDNGCWNWLGNLDYAGYSTSRTHRVFYKKYKGEIKEDEVIDHLCRNHRCINPNHLEAVSWAENARRGLQAKLTKGDVLKIRELKGKFTQKEIAIMFDINPCHVSRILNYKRWEVV